jgi:hypothetical protein
MKRKSGKQFILIPIGLFLTSCAFLISQRSEISDAVKGVVFGIPIGIMLFPFILTRFKKANC